MLPGGQTPVFIPLSLGQKEPIRLAVPVATGILMEGDGRDPMMLPRKRTQSVASS